MDRTDGPGLAASDRQMHVHDKPSWCGAERPMGADNGASVLDFRILSSHPGRMQSAPEKSRGLARRFAGSTTPAHSTRRVITAENAEGRGESSVEGRLGASVLLRVLPRPPRCKSIWRLQSGHRRLPRRGRYRAACFNVRKRGGNAPARCADPYGSHARSSTMSNTTRCSARPATSSFITPRQLHSEVRQLFATSSRPLGVGSFRADTSPYAGGSTGGSRMAKTYLVTGHRAAWGWSS